MRCIERTTRSGREANVLVGWKVTGGIVVGGSRFLVILHPVIDKTARKAVMRSKRR
jgi:hypothetical protein